MAIVGLAGGSACEARTTTRHVSSKGRRKLPQSSWVRVPRIPRYGCLDACTRGGDPLLPTRPAVGSDDKLPYDGRPPYRPIRCTATAHHAVARRRDRRGRRHRQNPWVQRLKRIHQAASSWWVFPTPSTSRFAHSLGHDASGGRVGPAGLPHARRGRSPAPRRSLRWSKNSASCRTAPRPRPRTLQPFLRREYLQPAFGVDHEQISVPHRQRVGRAHRRALARSPSGGLSAAGEAVDPWHVAFLRARGGEDRPRADRPRRARPPTPSRAGCTCCTAHSPAR